MARREVEAVEVVPRGLHLPAVDDRVSEPEEDVLELATDLRDQVEMPARERRPGHRDVDPLLRQAAVELCAGELCVPRLDRALEALAQRVERHPRLSVSH